MPLSTGIINLRDSLLELMNNPEGDVLKYADKLAESFDLYAKEVLPVSTTSSAAKAAMSATVLTAPRIEKAYEAYVAILAMGMAPLYKGTPPNPDTLNFDSLIPFALTGDKVSSATAQAALIHSWMLQGEATLVLPPATTQPWA